MRVVLVNKQIIDKRYRVKANQLLVPTSVIISTIYLAIDKSSQTQIDEYFKLPNWMFDPVENKLTNTILDYFERHNNIFRITCYDLLAERMSVFINLPKSHDYSCFDFIDSLIQKTTLQ